MKIKLQTGISTFVREQGDPSGLPVVFIHGFPFSHEMWKGQLEALPRAVRAIAYDVRGHGQTDVGDGQYTIELFVDDLIALLDHLNIQQAVLCGLSMGGYVALRAAERNPDRVRGLVLADTRSEADGNEAKVKRTGTLKGVKADGVATIAGNFVKAVFAAETFQSNPQAVELIKQLIIANSPIGICGTAIALAARTDTTATLSSIGVPTLILVGEQDALTPPAASQAMHEKIAGSNLVILKHAAHMSNVENRVEFNANLTKFLELF
jgi:3-oxoadipate enol-lactonase